MSERDLCQRFSKDRLKYSIVSSRLVWQCVRSFGEADEVLDMSPDEIKQVYEKAHTDVELLAG